MEFFIAVYLRGRGRGGGAKAGIRVYKKKSLKICKLKNNLGKFLITKLNFLEKKLKKFLDLKKNFEKIPESPKILWKNFRKILSPEKYSKTILQEFLRSKKFLISKEL